MHHFAPFLGRLIIGSVLLSNITTAQAYPYYQFDPAIEYFTRPDAIQIERTVQPVRAPAKRQQEQGHIQIPVTFGYVTRADFVMATITGLYPDGIPPECFEQLSPSNYYLLFSDVPKGADYSAHLCAAMIMGLVSGYPDITFHPNRPINYAEASKILTKAFGIASDALDPNIEWYTPYVEAMQAHNALPTGIALDDPVTPGMMSYMIAQLLT